MGSFDFAGYRSPYRGSFYYVLPLLGGPKLSFTSSAPLSLSLPAKFSYMAPPMLFIICFCDFFKSGLAPLGDLANKACGMAGFLLFANVLLEGGLYILGSPLYRLAISPL